MENSVVVVKANVKRITLQRIIISKIAFLGETDLEEIHVLFQNQLWLEQKCSTDREFAQKFGQSLEDISLILKQTNLSRGLTVGAVGSLGQKLKNLESFLIPRRNITTMVPLIRKSFYTKPYKETGIPTKQLPPKKVIGKGYRDHGTAQNVAVDGSPKWQEVATRTSFLERKIDELRENLQKDGQEPLTRLRWIGELLECRESLQRISSPKSNSRNAEKTKG